MAQNKSPILSDLLNGDRTTPGKPGAYSAEEMEKAAAEAQIGEIFGRMKKEAKEELAGTMGWAGNAFGTELGKTAGQQIAAAIQPLVVQLNKIATILTKVSEGPSDPRAPTNGAGIGAPQLSRDGLKPPEGQDGAKAEAELGVNREVSGTGWNAAADSRRESLQTAQVTTNTEAVSGTRSNPAVERPEDYEAGGGMITTAAERQTKGRAFQQALLKSLG